MKVDVVIPAYNEALVIKETIKKLVGFCNKALVDYDWCVVVVINGSNDNSPQIVKRLMENEPRLKMVEYKEGGRGQALKRYWLESVADILAYMDSDLAVDLEALPRLIKPLSQNDAEIAIGSRYQKGASVQRSLKREIISRAYNLCGKIIVPHKTKDLQCGFKAIKKTAFKKLSPYLNNSDWFFDTELIVWAEHFKIPIIEVAVDWRETRLGPRQSKVKLAKIPRQFIKPFLVLRKKIKNHNSL